MHKTELFNTESPITPNLVGIVPTDQLVSTKIRTEKVSNQSRENKLRETRSMRPLPFIPKRGKPKKPLRINRENEILLSYKKEK